MKIEKLLVSLTAIAAVILALYSTSLYGVGVSPDSANYIAAARNMLAGQGYVSYLGEPMVYWPPLFSSVLAFLGLFGLDPLVGARYVNAFVLGIIILIAGNWLAEKVSSRWSLGFGLLALLVSLPLLKVATYAWSEPFFLLFVLLFIFKLELYFKTKSKSSLILAATFAALTALTRYVGVATVFTGTLFLLFQRRVSFRQRIANIFIFGIISSLPTVLWLVRNYLATSTLTGVRVPGTFTLIENIRLTAGAIGAWFFPLELAVEKKTFALVVLVVVLFAFLIYYSMKSYRKTEFITIVPLLGFIGIFTGYLIYSATYFAFDALDYRLLSPVYVPLLLIVIFLADRIVVLLRNNTLAKSLAVTFLLLFGLWFSFAFKQLNQFISLSLEKGSGGYHTVSHMEGEFARYLRSYDVYEGVILSNQPDKLYILTGNSSQVTPRSQHYNSPSKVGLPTLKEWEESLPHNKDIYIFWFTPSSNFLYDIKEIKKVVKLTEVEVFSDGSIYKVEQ